MSAQQLKWIVVALGAALVLWLASELMSRPPDDRQTARALPEVPADSVTVIEIRHAADTILLGRFGDHWQVNGYDASPAKMDEWFRALADTTESEVVATSAAVHARMGVDTGGTRVDLRRGEASLAVLWFGKTATGNPRAAYVRRDGEDRVYAYGGGLVRLVALPVDDWRDKVIADIDPATVRHALMARHGDAVELVRAEDGWHLGREGKADSAAVAQFLGALRPLEATGFPTPAQADSVEFAHPDRRLVVLGQGGDTLAALLFDSTAGAYWVRPESGGTVYRIPTGRADRVVPAHAALFPKEGGGS